MSFKFIFWALGLYILYKLVFDFILPIARTTSNMRKQFKDMQEQMNDQFSSNHNTTSSANNQYKKQSNSKGEDEDYIDFEEVK